MSKTGEAVKGGAVDRSKLWDWVFRVLTALVIPLLIWGIKLEVNNAVLRERITQFKVQLEQRIGQCDRRIGERKADIVGINKTVHNNFGKLSAMDAKIEGIKNQLTLMRILLEKMKK